MRIKIFAAAFLMLAVTGGMAGAQSFDARRMGMGGVVLGGGPAGEAANVAYRAVPSASKNVNIPLPLGLIPVIADPPTFDSSNPDFNVFRLADLLYNPPWNLRIGGEDAPASDIVISIAKDRLAVDLGDIAKVFPEDDSRSGGISNGPAFSVGMRGFFAGVAPLIEYQNDLSLNDALRGALRHGQPFVPSTEYALFDNASGQAALGVHLGAALPLIQHGKARAPGSMGIYGGARLKILRGMAYGAADNVAAFTTDSVLFNDPVDLHYSAYYRTATPDGGRLGRGLDLGVVWLLGPTEVGLGVNDIATRIDWRVEESVAQRDSATGQYVRQVLRSDVPYTSEVPLTLTANAAVQLGGWLVAGDVVRGVNSTSGHLGAEIWLRNLALRAGAGIDGEGHPQFGCGTGVRFGFLGVDLALASNSRNVTHERSYELGAGLALYR